MHRDTPRKPKTCTPNALTGAARNAQPLKLISTGALFHKPSPLSITELNPCVSVSPIGSSEADVFVQKASASASNVLHQAAGRYSTLLQNRLPGLFALLRGTSNHICPFSPVLTKRLRSARLHRKPSHQRNRTAQTPLNAISFT